MSCPELSLSNPSKISAEAHTERDKTFYESKCGTLDRQIDHLVYELYDLTPDEVAIVEDGAQN